MPRDNQLDEKLWEYVYDLLPDGERQEWTDRITSDPEVARAFAEIKSRTERISDAVRVNVPPMDWRGQPAAQTDLPLTESGSRASLQSRRTTHGHRARVWGNVLAAAAALLLIAMMSTARWTATHRDVALGDLPANLSESESAARPIRTTVFAPGTMVEGASNAVTVLTRDLKNVPAPTEVDVQIQDQQQQIVWKDSGKTDANGVWQVSIPAPLAQNDFSFFANARQSPATTSTVLPIRVAAPKLNTLVTTDRAVYEPGEPVHVRSLTLSRPGARDAGEIDVDYKIVREADAAVVQSTVEAGRTIRGVAANSFQLDQAAPEGEYSVVASSAHHLFADAKRTFHIERADEPRLKVDIEFSKAEYAPGEQVTVDFGVGDLGTLGEQPSFDKLRFELRAGVAGQWIAEDLLEATPDGSQQATFELPMELPSGPAFLEVVAHDDERWARNVATIPIRRSNADLHFFPEGGDLAAELPNRVYFEAISAQGKPLAVRGRLVDPSGNGVATFATDPGERNGRGRFTFVPEPGTTYGAIIEWPTGLSTDATLTASATEFRATLHAGESVFRADDPLNFDVYANADGRPMVVAIACGGVDVGQFGFDSRRGSGTHLQVPVTQDAEGVLRVTLFDFHGTPPRAIAERLVYRHPARKLILHSTEALAAIEGRPVRYDLSVLDESGQAADAIVGAVVRRTDRFVGDEVRTSLPTDYFLLSDIDEPEAWEDARVYLADHPDAARSLDLLLGTHGWRRIEEWAPQQLAMRLRRQSSHADNADKAEVNALAKRDALAINEWRDDSAIIEPPSMADNLDRVLATRADSPRAGDQVRIAPSHAGRTVLASPNFGRALLVVSIVVVAILLALGLLRMASTWVWLPTACLAALALVVAMRSMGGPRAVRDSSETDQWIADSEEHIPVSTERPAPRSVESDIEGARELARPPAPAGGFGGGDPSASRPADAAAMPGTPGRARGGASASGPGLAGRAGGGGGAGAGAAAPGAEAKSSGQEKGRALREGGSQDHAGIVPRVSRVASLPPLSLAVPGERPAPASGPPRDANTRPIADGTSETRREELHERLGNLAQRRVFNPYFYDAKSASSSAGPPATIYWHPFLAPDRDGRMTVNFDMPRVAEGDLPARWEFHAVAHGSQRLGEMRSTIETRPPVELTGDLPRQVVVGDEFTIRLGIANHDIREVRATARLESALPDSALPESIRLIEVEPSEIDLTLAAGANETLRPIVRARRSGHVPVEWRVASDDARAVLARSLTIIEPGYPVEYLANGEFGGNSTSGADSERVADLNLPGSITIGALIEKWSQPPSRRRAPAMVELRVYPSLSSEVRAALIGLVVGGRPSAMGALAARKVQRWFDEHHIADPAFKRALKGWESAIEGHTVNGPFTDEWENAWYRAELGLASDDGARPRAWPDGAADPSQVALAARVAVLEARPEAAALVHRLKELQMDDGHLPCSRSFAARSDEGVTVEATAWAAMAWSHPDVAVAFEGPRRAALAWLRRQRTLDGGFGGAEATALVVLALLGDTAHPVVADEAIDLTLRGLPGGEVTTLRVAQGSIRGMAWDRFFADGEVPADLTATLSRPTPIPYVVGLRLMTAEPPDRGDGPFTLTTGMEASELKLGESTSMRVHLEGRVSGPVILRIGIPAGLMVDMRDLPPTCELVDGYLLVRLTGPFLEPRDWMKAEGVVEFELPVTATFAGTFGSPPSRVYLEHAPSRSAWSSPLTVVVRE